MPSFIEQVPRIDLVLAASVLFALLVTLGVGRRGGRFRALPAWAGFSAALGAVLAALSLAPRWLSFPLVAVGMFTALRAYFSVAPVRPRDRYAILASYLSIPLVMWPAYIGSDEAFLATVPVLLFLFIPVFLVIGKAEKGMLDAMGRTILGVLFFVFCSAHLTLMIDLSPDTRGLPELFGVLVLASDLPQRLAGRSHHGVSWHQVTMGIVVSIVLAVGVGFWLGPWCGLVEEDGGRAGALVAIAVTLGRRVGDAVAYELALSSSSRVGRGAILDRAVPTVYAAPVFFHYVNQFV